MRTKLCVLGWLSLTLTACNHNAPKPALKADQVQPTLSPRRAVLSLAETSSVTALALDGRFLYVGSHGGLVRFPVAESERQKGFVRLTKDEGLSGNRVSAMAASPGAGLWVATDGGISRLLKGVWTNVPLAKPMAVGCMAATRKHLWVGGPKGLARLADVDGLRKWSAHLPGVRVNRLMPDLGHKGVWIGTDGEGIYYGVDGKFESYDPSRGQDLRAVRGMTITLDGGVIAVGKTAQGKDRLVFFDGQQWTTYTPSPAADLHWVTMVKRQVLIAHGDRVLVLKRADLTLNGPRRLPVGPVKLTAKRSRTAPASYPMPHFYTEELKMWLPPRPTVVAGQGENVLIGTETLGAVIYDGQRPRWFRTNDLIGQGTEKLKLGCGVSGCFLAGGKGRAYRFDKQQRRFMLTSIDADSTVYVQAFATDGAGTVVALTSPANRASLTLVRQQGKDWIKQKTHVIKTPGSSLKVRFARFAPSGELWVGLSYLGVDGERRPWGVAVLSGGGKMLYHRSSLLPSEDRPTGSLALPDDIRDVHFHAGEIWLATDGGLCRVRGTKVDLVTENEGLESELTYAVATRSAELVVASYGGVGRFDGKHWRFDFGEDLTVSSRALAVLGSTLWAGTSRGLVKVSKDGDHERIGPEDGLASAEVRDIVHADGQLWVMTDSGVSILKP